MSHRTPLLSGAEIRCLRAWPKSGPFPFQFPWPMPGDPAQLMHFAVFDEWLECVGALSLHEAVPGIIANKYRRAQKLMAFAWTDVSLAIAAELVALPVLELALNDAYGREALPWAIAKGIVRKPKKKEISNKVQTAPFAALLRYMVEEDDLTDDKVGLCQRCRGGAVIGLLTGATKPTLAEIRNSHAHGYPFDGMPRSGLIELVRDLIEYAQRARIAEFANL